MLLYEGICEWSLCECMCECFCMRVYVSDFKMVSVRWFIRRDGVCVRWFIGRDGDMVSVYLM